MSETPPSTPDFESMSPELLALCEKGDLTPDEAISLQKFVNDRVKGVMENDGQDDFMFRPDADDIDSADHFFG